MLARLASIPARNAVLVVVTSLALIAALWVVTLERIGFERGEAIAEAVRTNSNLALAFEEHTIRTMRGIDQALQVAAHEYGNRGSRESVRALIESGAIDRSVFQHIDLLDERGDSVLEPLAKRPNGADRDFFRFHRDTPAARLRIGIPLVGRVTGLTSIQMTRRIDRPDGSFGGVALASVNPEFFSAFFRNIDLGRDSMIQLVGLDGVVRARRSGTRNEYGQDLKQNNLFKNLAHSPVGSFVTSGRISGVVRHMSYRVVSGYPLVVAVSTSVEEVLGKFRDRRRNYLAGAALASLLVLLFACGLLIAMRRQWQARQETARGEARYRATFDQSGVGIAHTALDGRFLKVNRKLCDMLGYGEPELLSLSWRGIIHSDDLKEIADLMRRMLADPAFAAPEVEKRFVCKDGSVRWGVATPVVVRDADGKPEYMVAILQDATARRQVQEQLAYQAHYDALTGLPNRVLFNDRVAQALAQARRKHSALAVMFFDLDRFKEVNDTLGHAVGDELLREAAKRLRQCVRAGDTAARVGGDEFGVILTEIAHPQDARLVAEKIVRAMAAPHYLEGHEAFVSASIGIAMFPLDGEDRESLVRNADAAMFRAKRAGRNSFRFYTAAMNERAMENMLLENDLRHALERNEFEIHYQPKAIITGGELAGFEALLRWRRPASALVSPAQFIPMLEDSGLIVPVGDWIIGAVCAQLSAWQKAGLRPVPVSVNLCAKQFLHHDIAAVIDAALLDHGVDPDLLDIEITESDAMQDPELVVGILQRLRQRGIRVAIDDFGTGYSSLGYLKRFPLDALKIDRSFVTGLPDDAEDVSIAQAVIGMAHSLGLKVVAEGVETEEQRRFLAAHGCDQMQGYLLSRPVPAADCLRFFALGRTHSGHGERRQPVPRLVR